MEQSRWSTILHCYRRCPAINYKNGEKETFDNVGANVTANETPSEKDAMVNPTENVKV